MREVRGLRKRYEALGKDIELREDAISEMLEIMRQYEARNQDLEGLLAWSRPIKARLLEPVPDNLDMNSLQTLITEHKVSWGLAQGINQGGFT